MISKRAFAFPEQRKEPRENATDVRNAIARFKQVKDVSDERDAAWKRIEATAKKHGVEIRERAGAKSVGSDRSVPARLLQWLTVRRA